MPCWIVRGYTGQKTHCIEYANYIVAKQDMRSTDTLITYSYNPAKNKGEWIVWEYTCTFYSFN